MKGLGRERFLGSVLFLAVVLAYSPVWRAGFIWDDSILVTANPCIIGPLGLQEIWTTHFSDISLTLTTFWVEHALWGLAPLPYHLVNVFLHGACALVLWRVLRSLQIPGAWLGAALWALHPVQVDSVAWVSEMKNTQSGLFFLLSIFFFVRFLKAGSPDVEIDGRQDYPLSLLFAALAMVSKSSTVILPLALCLCAWWIEGRWRGRSQIKTVPFFLMSIATAAVTIWRQHQGGANDPQWARGWPERAATAGDAIWFYLGKLLWPHPLSLIYPRWEIGPVGMISFLPLLAAIVVLAVFYLACRGWARPWYFAFAYFVAALLPILGLVSQYFDRFSFVADHFQYLASMAPLALAGAGMARWAESVMPGRLGVPSTLAAGLLLVLGLMSWRHVRVYENGETVWADTLAKNPRCWLADNNLGAALFEEGQADPAMALYRESLAINPAYADPYYNLGNALAPKGEIDAAMAEYEKAVELNPDFVEARTNLGHLLLGKGRLDEAVAQFRTALQTNAVSVEARLDLARALSQQGRLDEAIDEGQKVLEIDPGSVDARNIASAALLQRGRADEAAGLSLEAVQLDPRSVEAHANLGYALLQLGRADEAAEQCRDALALDPGNAGAHYNLGNALLQKKQVDEAMAEFQAALKINPGLAQIHISLGNALLIKGQLDAAIAQYGKALEIDPGNLGAHNNLGMALVQKGDVDGAIVQFQKALAINSGMPRLHDNLGNALLEKGRRDEAALQYQAALQMNPGDVDAQSGLAKAHGGSSR